MPQIKITQVKSAIDRPERQKRTIAALGLKKLHQTIVHEETPQLLGMIRKVNHLITIEQI
ncbi:MAG: 50S ribosomal protein L30 [Flavobacterium sp.]|nr:MAG: 50S ribosomal protein L30 [Flavobacterium sp.]